VECLVEWVAWEEWEAWGCNFQFSKKNYKRAVFTALFFYLILKSTRLRKAILDPHERKRSEKSSAAA